MVKYQQRRRQHGETHQLNHLGAQHYLDRQQRDRKERVLHQVRTRRDRARAHRQALGEADERDQTAENQHHEFNRAQVNQVLGGTDLEDEQVYRGIGGEEQHGVDDQPQHPQE
jgi:hypothetical protein